MKNVVKFAMEDVEWYAKFVAELTKANIAFTAELRNGEFIVTITGY